MKTTTLAITLSMLTLCSVGSAVAASSQQNDSRNLLSKPAIIDLGSGTVNPNGKAEISLKPLFSGIRYDVTCSLQTTGTAIMAFRPGSGGSNPFMVSAYYLNGKRFDGQGSVKKGANTFLASRLIAHNDDDIFPGAPLQMLNLDDTTVVEYHCQAQASN